MAEGGRVKFDINVKPFQLRGPESPTTENESPTERVLIYYTNYLVTYNSYVNYFPI